MKSNIKKSNKNFLDLKVYVNKKNGQGIVLLPRRKMNKLPSRVKIKRW